MRLALHALALLVVAVALAGQTPADTVELNPVVVTATRIPTPADGVPVAVTVLRGTELRERGILTVAEALRGVPAASVVTTSSYGSQTSLFLRGGQSNYVKVLIDGVPQNAPGGAYDFANLTTDNIERIEVVRGPASVLYGSDAVAGVVQIFTRDGGGAAHGSLAARGGTYGSGALDATLSGGDGRASYALSVSRFLSDGLDSINNQFQNEVFSARARYQPDGRTDAALSIRYGDALYHFPRVYRGVVVSNNQHQRERGPSVGVDFGHTFSEPRCRTLDADALRGARLRRPEQLLPPRGSETETRRFARTGKSGAERNHVTVGASLPEGERARRRYGQPAA